MAQSPINIPDLIEELKQARGQMMQGPHGTLFNVQPTTWRWVRLAVNLLGVAVATFLLAID